MFETMIGDAVGRAHMGTRASHGRHRHNDLSLIHI